MSKSTSFVRQICAAVAQGRSDRLVKDSDTLFRAAQGSLRSFVEDAQIDELPPILIGDLVATGDPVVQKIVFSQKGKERVTLETAQWRRIWATMPLQEIEKLISRKKISPKNLAPFVLSKFNARQGEELYPLLDLCAEYDEGSSLVLKDKYRDLCANKHMAPAAAYYLKKQVENRRSKFCEIGKDMFGSNRPYQSLLLQLAGLSVDDMSSVVPNKTTTFAFFKGFMTSSHTRFVLAAKAPTLEQALLNYKDIKDWLKETLPAQKRVR